MNAQQLITTIRSAYSGVGPPASATSLRNLESELGPVPELILALYADHNGQPGSAIRPGPGARAMAIDEAIKTNREINEVLAGAGALGPVAWLWTDDNSNYVGFYRKGLLAGWITTCDHEEQILTPRHRSAEGFIRSLVASARGSTEKPAYDAPSIPGEFPLVTDDPSKVGEDRALVSAIGNLRRAEADEDLRSFYVMCEMALTPVSDTASLLPFLREDDIWIPKAAANIFDLRRYLAAIPELERLAVEGTPNGDSAAMRCLVRFNTEESRAAVARLLTRVSGRKLAALRMWVNRGAELHPVRWP